ncbi:MAG TPA: hypothetical protein VIV60_09820 [Polyangiaceae bacterium]
MASSSPPESEVLPAVAFYRNALQALDNAGVEYLIGGGYAMAHYADIRRNTKDLDVYVRPGASRHAYDTLGEAGCRLEWPWPHFLARARSGGDAFIDILYSSGNGITDVDEEWYEHATDGDLFERKVRFVPAEEMMWTKCFVQERDRYDGADVAHLLLRCGKVLDWQRLLRRTQGHDGVLLAHLLFFEYIYPKEPRIPAWVRDELLQRLSRESPPEQRLCRGTNLAPHQYRPDVEQWGFIDARRRPHGPLRLDDIARFMPPDAQPIR